MTFQDYLVQYKIDSRFLSEAELERLKIDFKRQYARDYQRELRQRTKRIEFVLTPADHLTIKSMAKQYREGIGSFSRKAILAYIQSEMYFPVSKKVEHTHFLLLKAGNNLNQLTRYTHQQKSLNQNRLLQLIEQVQQMQRAINELYQSPKVIVKPIDLIQ